MQKVPDKNAKLFEKYIADKKILIADVSASSRAGLAKTMINLGAKATLITLAQSYAEAEQEMARIKPHVVLCDYNLGPRCGLDLLQEQRKQNPDSKNSLFVLVTGNTSQSAVAQAAEEDIDMFILKPYTIEVLRNSIIRGAISKIYPSDYVKTIEEGKKLLFAGKADESMVIFERAMKLDPKPSLACFYHGQASLMKQALEPAQKKYSEGLEFNKIHYKCLVGLFELLMTKKLYNEAYDTVKRIARYFPANPQRLNTVLRLAIMTKNYEDIERYYQAFIAMDERNEDLVRYVCAALVVCGKFYLQKNLASRALELFQKAGTTASGRVNILREIIMALLSFDLAKEAPEFLRRFPPDAQSGPDFLALEYAVLDKSAPAGVVIERGRQLVAKGVHDSLIYKVLIRRSRETGFQDSAESLTHDALAKWPDQKDEILKALQSWTKPMGEKK